MLLNTKSIIDCNEDEEIIHNEEIEWLIEQIKALPNYECLVVKEYFDSPCDKKFEDNISVANLYDCLSTIETEDIKNGIDLTIGDNNIFTIIAFGQVYEFQSQLKYYKTYIHIMPYDENRDFLDISGFLENIVNHRYVKNFA